MSLGSFGSIFGFCLFALTQVAYAAGESSGPNVLFIIADDLGYGELGCYGGTEIPTPHLDALAVGGARFTDGYVTAPFCAASRAAIMTGRYQTRFGFEFNPIGAKNAYPGIGLPTNESTIADAMRGAGYATGLVGKWHLGGTAPFHPQRRGFDEFFGFLHEGHFFVEPSADDVTTWLRRKALPDGHSGRWVSRDGKTIWTDHMGHNEPPYDADNPVMRSSQPVVIQKHLTDAFADESIDFIKRHADQPFFLCLSYNAVHSPMQADENYRKKFASIDDIHRRIFAAMLGHLDDSIGQIMGEIENAGLRENTMVIFLSDNGGPTKELTSSNAPLRGGKGELYEGGVRVPMMVSWPGKIAPRVIEHPVTSMDLMATAVAVSGDRSGSPQEPAIDGVDLMPLMTRGVALAPRPIHWRVGDRHATRIGPWKIVRRLDRQGEGDWQLYQLADDIGESKNLAAAEPDKVRELSQAWRHWNAEQVAPAWK
ncbi:sulfatase [Rubripirellula tenax]|nr:sulfatase [Rubripirellula tenax]